MQITYVMGGLAREYGGELSWLVREWLDASDRSRMPLDPRAWGGPGALRSSFPACIAVKAAQEQGAEPAARYLRALREGILCGRRKLDAAEALVEEARRAGLDADRFRVDLDSNATLERFGADLEETRDPPHAARARGLMQEGTHGSRVERLVFPALRFVPAGDDEGEEGWRGGDDDYDDWRAAAIGAGAQPAGEPPPDVPGALARFGRLATVELEAACGLPGPRAPAELWRLAGEWRVRPLRVLTGELWELA